MVKFRKNKKEKVVEFKDEREPNIRFAILLMIRIVGWEMIWIIIGMLGYACFGAMPHIFNILMGELINIVVGADVTSISDKINNLAMWMAIIAAIAAILTWIGGSMMAYSFERIGVRLKNAYIESLMKQEIGYFDMKRTGELMSWMTESMEQIQDSFSNKLGRATQFFMQVILGIILALVFSWKMALVMISFAPVIIFIMFASGLASQLITKRTLKISNEASAIANEVISAVRTVRSMDSENKEINRYKNKLWSGNVLYVIRAIILGAPIGAQEVSIWGVLALGMWWGGQLLVKSEIAFANMFRVFTLLLMSVLGSSQIMSVIPDLTRAIQSSKNLLKVIRRIPATRFDGGITPEKIIGEIEFKDVCFSYPTRPNIQVLKNFSLTIKPGQAIALVGSSGSGKSTIISLLERFYEPISGNIILDGNELTEIDPHWLRTHVGLVGQEPVLFSGSIKENICYAIRKSATDPFPSDEEIINAAKAANAHDFISALPDGYNTVLGERGVSLSGGQKQRIAIARSVIQNPEILLLDEATSALDTNSEAVVQDALNRLMKGRTTIVIAHRLSTIVNSDLICVFHKGELKEQGTHDQLMNTGGLYSELAKKQMMRKQDSSEELVKIVSEEEIGIETPYKSQATFETVVSKESLSSNSDE